MTEEEIRKRGRPAGYKKKNPASETLPRVRITESQLSAYKDASSREELTLSAWIRKSLDKASSR